MADTFSQRATQLAGTLTSQGYIIDTSPTALGELTESNALQGDVEALHRRMDEDGYLFLRGYLDREQVLAVRQEFVRKLDRAGLIDHSKPLLEAIYSGSNNGLIGTSRPAFAKDLRTGPALRTLCHSGRAVTFFERFFGGPVLPYTYIWVRTVRAGSSSGVHFDWVYMSRGTANLYTAWIPIGDVPLRDGPLMVLERSHQIEELRGDYGQIDADRDRVFSNAKHRYAGGWLTKDAPAVQARFGTRWLTTDFCAGDLLVFTMFTLHCSLDNASPDNRIRLSVDARYQPAGEPYDERWMGEDYFGDGMD